MAAAVAKLCDVHELILLARKMQRTSARPHPAGPARHAVIALQPNHPTDDLRGVTLLVYWGSVAGRGRRTRSDSILPSTRSTTSPASCDTSTSSAARLRVPTQICVLAHVKTQLACLDAVRPSRSCSKAWPAPSARNL